MVSIPEAAEGVAVATTAAAAAAAVAAVASTAAAAVPLLAPACVPKNTKRETLL